MNSMIGCCGLNCETCDARIATITNDDALREKTAALWSKLNGVPITADMLSCTGCRIDGAKTPFCDQLCAIRSCAREKAMATCADCPQMDVCGTLHRVTDGTPVAMANLKKLQKEESETA